MGKKFTSPKYTLARKKVKRMKCPTCWWVIFVAITAQLLPIELHAESADGNSNSSELATKLSESVQYSFGKDLDFKASDAYDFIFGWSTGHVGTTSTSQGKLYGNPDDVVFLHETHNGKYNLNDKLHTERWMNTTYSEEYEWVKSEYIPFLLKCRGKKRTLLDMGHNNMYFVDALIAYLLNETNYRFIFVRIRRERLESGLSLIYKTPTEQHQHICHDLVTRYCPFNRIEDVALHPPDRQTWRQMTIFQQAMWMVDEVEARWNRLLTRHPSMERLELLWGKCWDGSFDRMAARIAALMGITRKVHFDENWKVENPLITFNCFSPPPHVSL